MNVMKGMIEHLELCRQMEISPVTLWRMRKRPGFPAAKRVGIRLYFNQQEVNDYLRGVKHEG